MYCSDEWSVEEGGGVECDFIIEQFDLSTGLRQWDVFVQTAHLHSDGDRAQGLIFTQYGTKCSFRFEACTLE